MTSFTDPGVLKPSLNVQPTMEVTRIIHPVGQGGFYTEALSNGNQEATFVYDCGGFDKEKKKMTDYLDSFLHSENAIKNPGDSGKKKIEAVFISHFHADHINGLEYLLKNANVKYLILPQMTEDIMIEAFVYNFYSTKQNNGVNNFLLQLYRGTAQFGPTKIIQVGYPEDSRVPEEFSREIFSKDSLDLQAWDWRQRKVIDLSTVEILPANVVLHCYKWLYITHNSKISDPSKLTKLREKLTDLFKTKVTIDNLPSLIKQSENNSVNEIKKIYKEVFGSKQNPTSMTLFSGTFEHVRRESCRIECNCIPCHPYCKRFYEYPYCCNPNILYTGDFEPENNILDLRKFYLHCWDRIATIQVPHHGSKDNYDDNLYSHAIRGIVSVGNNNSYHHPDIETLIKIQNKGCHPVIVTEDKSSMKIYHYSL